MMLQFRLNLHDTVKKIMRSCGQDSFTLITELDTIFMGSWDYSGNYQTPEFMPKIMLTAAILTQSYLR